MKTLLKSLFTAWFVVSAAFLCLRLAPGDPIERILGPQARAEQIESFRAKLNLDKSISNQYVIYLKDLIRLDWGKSLFRDRPVVEMIGEAIVPTVKLAVIAIVIAFLLASFIGIYAAKNQGKTLDHGIRLASLISLAFPIFSLGPILIILFAIEFQLLPVSELLTVKHYILPVLSLVIPLASVLSRVVRNQYLEIKNEQWTTVLKAKGLSDFKISLFIYKVCLPTVLNVVSLQLSVILAGAMITETIFDIPGLGRLLLTAIENRDYPLVQGLIIYTSLIYLVIYALTDLINSKIDPRLERA